MGSVNRNILEEVIKQTRGISDGEIQRIRTYGLGNGFLVTDTRDGFRQDGALWFGTCETCGETVTNSWRDGVWTHTTYTSKTYYSTGHIATSTSKQTDYCPVERGESVECEVKHLPPL
jgi:hypothetical protein